MGTNLNAAVFYRGILTPEYLVTAIIMCGIFIRLAQKINIYEYCQEEQRKRVNIMTMSLVYFSDDSGRIKT